KGDAPFLGCLWQFVPRTWSMRWSTTPHWPRNASTPTGPSDCTKMLAQWFGNPPDPLPWNPGPGWACEYPTLWYPCTAASRYWMVRSLLAIVVDTTFSAVIRLASWARRWSTAWVTLARPLTSRLTCWAFPAVIWLTSRSRLLRAAASDLRSSRTETSLSEVM